MPCLAIHLAVAKKYLDKHPEENKDEFILGSISPDIEMDNLNDYLNGEFTDKNSRHFGKNFVTDNLIEYLKKKVDFKLFFEKNNLDTSFRRAYYLHLLCDYYFFGEYIKDEQLSHYTYEEAVKLGYNDYDLITPILIKKYNLEVPEQIEDIINKKGKGTFTIFNESTVDKFIEEMSNLNLDKEKEKAS